MHSFSGKLTNTTQTADRPLAGKSLGEPMKPDAEVEEWAI